MNVLVDTSVWVDYFRGGGQSEKLDVLIDENLLVINDLILAELVPFLQIRKQKKIIALLNEIRRLELNIDWEEIIKYQTRCLKKGINGVGLPDLIIAQNAKEHRCAVYSADKHFKTLKEIAGIKLL